MTSKSDEKVDQEASEPGIGSYMIGVGASIIFFFIVGNYNVSPGTANMIGLLLFIVSFGIIIKINWKWFEPALDFNLEDLGFNQTPSFMRYSEAMNKNSASNKEEVVKNPPSRK